MTTSSSSADIFNYFVNVVSLTGLITWACILFLHIRFMQALTAQGFDRKRDLNYRSPLQPYGSYISLVICILVILIKNFTVFLGNDFPYKTFITGYIILPIFIIMLFGYKFIKKTQFVPSNEVDLDTYRDVIEAEEAEFQEKDDEMKAIREAQGNPKDWKWFYEKVFGWVF